MSLAKQVDWFCVPSRSSRHRRNRDIHKQQGGLIACTVNSQPMSGALTNQVGRIAYFRLSSRRNSVNRPPGDSSIQSDVCATRGSRRYRSVSCVLQSGDRQRVLLICQTSRFPERGEPSEYHFVRARIPVADYNSKRHFRTLGRRGTVD